MLFYVLAALILIVLALLWAGGLYFFKTAIRRTPKTFLVDNPNLMPEPDNEIISSAADLKWLDAQPAEEISIQSHDGLKLHGTWLSSNSGSDQTVILAHGYSGKGREMAGFARFYGKKHGYNVLMPDDRGHGQSEGDIIGFGWLDRKDYVQWTNWVLEKVGTQGEIVLHGISMGGATVLMTGGEALPIQVKAIVSDCAYTSVEEELTFQLKQLYKLPAFPFIPVTSLISRWKAGYSFKEASALKQLAKVNVPVLFIHGEADTFVPTEMVYRLYEACPTEKELLTVPRAGHGTAFQVDRTGYEAVVESFLEKNLSPSNFVSESSEAK
ncbi:alpha/beta hydrolase [Paenibacillus amylolyticus]|uniref:Alpha/beta superfamily hydrolase n=1 Tax=Paenibacillus amylolyticus TaxID=1451 RepID=A0A100VJC2_PAEAM|nr:alpha/beta hydrolase [Paenibacillus amylolyticus]GAS80935.1 alpha/beta superfamily hydrolase [Paenibacillus amylolyticus]